MATTPVTLNAAVPFDQVDPFTQCYANLRRVLLADAVLGNPALAVGIRGNNMPDITAALFAKLNLRAPGDLLPADCPEVLLLSGQFRISLSGVNSKAAEFTQTYPLMCTFADQNGGRPNLFKFRLMCAFSKPGVDRLGLPSFVKGVELIDGQDDILGQQAVKELQDRWTVFGGVRVHGFVTKDYLATA